MKYHKGETYTYDKSGNLEQNGKWQTEPTRMFTSSGNNRSIDQLSFNQDPDIDRHFDPHGNQLNTGYSHLHNSWDFINQLQTTAQPLKNGYTLIENNTFGAPGQRTRKVSEFNNPSGNTVEIEEVLYQKTLEYHTIWQGTNLEYDGESVTDNGQMIPPTNSYQARRIRQNHRQLAQEIIQGIQDEPLSKTTAYYLVNHLDSCELLINEGAQLESYQSFDPFGNSVETFGDIEYKTVKYSGETKDQTGLYNYGFRSYLPENFRWTSPDPAKQAGSGLNRYAMVENNPMTERDEKGLGWIKDLGNLILPIIAVFTGYNIALDIRNYRTQPLLVNGIEENPKLRRELIDGMMPYIALAYGAKHPRLMEEEGFEKFTKGVKKAHKSMPVDKKKSSKTIYEIDGITFLSKIEDLIKDSRSDINLIKEMGRIDHTLGLPTQPYSIPSHISHEYVYTYKSFLGSIGIGLMLLILHDGVFICLNNQINRKKERKRLSEDVIKRIKKSQKQKTSLRENIKLSLIRRDLGYLPAYSAAVAVIDMSEALLWRTRQQRNRINHQNVPLLSSQNQNDIIDNNQNNNLNNINNNRNDILNNNSNIQTTFINKSVFDSRGNSVQERLQHYGLSLRNSPTGHRQYGLYFEQNDGWKHYVSVSVKLNNNKGGRYKATINGTNVFITENHYQEMIRRVQDFVNNRKL